MPGWKSLTNICDPLLRYGETGDLPRCDFSALLILIKNGMTDLILISTLVVVIALVIAGVKLVTAGMRGDYNALSDVRGTFGRIILGYAIILLSWLLVYTITSTLLNDNFSLL